METPQTTPQTKRGLRERRIANGILGWVDRLPPFLAYAVARHGQRDRSLATMVAASGLSERTFLRIARRISWADVTLGQASAFCRACEVDLLCLHVELAYLRRTIKNKRSFGLLTRRQRTRLISRMREFKASAAAGHQS